MRLATIVHDGTETAAVVAGDGLVTVDACNQAWRTDFPATLLQLLRSGRIDELAARVVAGDVPLESVTTSRAFGPPYRDPGKIWGIGLNYRDHARALDEDVPEEPASFMKPRTAIIGAGDPIRLPAASERVTAEAELAVVIGHGCRDATAEEARRCVLGFTAVIDATAEDILRRNPRFLTRAKSFDSFFSFGPIVATTDELPSLDGVVVRTVLNDEVRAERPIAEMTFDPYELVRFHSQGMTLEPGDVISTGTPGAVAIGPGDRVRCSISGLPDLDNPVERGSP